MFKTTVTEPAHDDVVVSVWAPPVTGLRCVLTARAADAGFSDR